MCGCKNNIPLAYNYRTAAEAFNFSQMTRDDKAAAFASSICVVSDNKYEDSIDMNMATSAGLFDVSGTETLYAKNVHKQMNPASLTKVMTALLALKYGNLEDTITASANVHITESGAQLVGFKEGDRLTVEQALHALLIYSGNDAAVVLGEYVSGNLEEFCDLMNQEALMLGATHTHFTNPHGLTDENHFTTAYDLYLIFNEAMKYDKFREIINLTEYSTTYSDREGNIKEMNFNSTNMYFSGKTSSPENVTVIGGKTGTTNAAGSCLILLSNDKTGNPYISVILQATDRDSLYNEMNILLDTIN